MSDVVPSAGPSATVLPREWAHFLMELSIALQNYGVYPPGHPFLARGATVVAHRLHGLLLNQPSLSIGVAQDQLIIEGIATERGNPVLAGLASRLHRHSVGAISLNRQVDEAEVSRLLTLLASDPERTGEPSVLARAGELTHARIYPLSYAELQLVSSPGPGDLPGPGGGGSRASELWIGLARAALSDDKAEQAEPEQVADAINAHRAETSAYDQVIVGYLLQLSEELRSGDGHGSAEVRRRVTDALARLTPAALQRLVEMGGDLSQRRRFVLDASHAFSADAVVRLVEAAGGASHQAMSHSMLRLLSKLAMHASGPQGAARELADVELRTQVQELVSNWGLRDQNPATYTLTLDQLAGVDTGPGGGSRGDHAPEPERVLQMSLEMGSDSPSLGIAVARLLASGKIAALVAALDGAPAGSPVAARLWPVVASPDTVRLLLRQGPASTETLDRVLLRLGDDAVGPLLEELLESDSRQVRRAALDRLSGMGRVAGAEAVRRLDDPRWYVIRNLLGILAEVGCPPGFSVQPFLRHKDSRVRREAFKLALQIREERARAIALSLTDSSAQIQLMGLNECVGRCPSGAVTLVCAHAANPQADAETRRAAIRALSTVQDQAALVTLLQLVDGGRTLFRRRRLAATTPIMLAALAALAAGWREHRDAAPFIALALTSPDQQVTAAALTRRDS
jgi:hypothetical protein